MVTWSAFAAAERELADAGRSLLFQFNVGLAFLATVRQDGGPRLHPVCPVLSSDRLFVLITAASPKRNDLLRDGRYALQTFPQPKAGSEEFYVAGKALLVEDSAAREAALGNPKHGPATREPLSELGWPPLPPAGGKTVPTPGSPPGENKGRGPE